MSWLLDTVTVSELRRDPDPGVERWAQTQDPSSMYLSSVTVFELERGVLRKERSDPRQGAILRRWLDGSVLPRFAGRILAVDSVAARFAAALHIPDPRPAYDAMIAGIALAHDLTLVTRNSPDFEPLGVRVLNPWSS